MVGCSHCKIDSEPVSQGAWRVLWVALFANAIMFAVEVIGSYLADSVSVKADALDFFGDAANYAVTLFVLGMSIRIRARASMMKGIVMAVFGVWVLGSAIYNLRYGSVPESRLMGVFGILALIVNLGVALILYKYRDGDSNMQSVWLCSRNDAIGNLTVLLAAVGVHYTGKNVPDLVVAIMVAVLGISSGVRVIELSRKELAGA